MTPCGGGLSVPCLLPPVISHIAFPLPVRRLSSAAALSAADSPPSSREQGYTSTRWSSGTPRLKIRSGFKPRFSSILVRDFHFRFHNFFRQLYRFLYRSRRSHRSHHSVSCNVASKVSGYFSPKALFLASTSSVAPADVALCVEDLLEKSSVRQGIAFGVSTFSSPGISFSLQSYILLGSGLPAVIPSRYRY